MQAFNKHEYLFHAWCDVTKLHFAQSDFSRTILAQGTIAVINYIENQFSTQTNGIKIRQIHGDQDSVTGTREFSNFLKERGIRFTPSALYSPQHNGLIERAGGVITQVARALHIDSCLLRNL